MSEFNLSNRINSSLSNKVPEGYLFEGDVREFIRQLRRRAMTDSPMSTISFIEMIEELAGERLA